MLLTCLQVVFIWMLQILSRFNVNLTVITGKMQ